jgi:hypothetical protein
METVLITPPTEAFGRTFPGQKYNPDLDAKILHIGGASKKMKQRKLNNIYHILGTTSEEARELYYKRMMETLREGKVYAEIQLVLEYERRTARLPPRAICSSKDACYLCNVFILVHGKLHIPRCHGRLYPGWRLPETFGPELQLRFNKVLEDHVRDSLNILTLRGTRTVYDNPNESTLHSIPGSMSTLLNGLLPTATVEHKKLSQQPPPQAVTTASHSSVEGTKNATSIIQQSIPVLQGSIPNSEVEVEKDSTQATSKLETPPPHNSAENASPQTTSSQLPGISAPSGSIGSAEWELRRGKTRFTEVQAHGASLLYLAGQLEIQVEDSPQTGLESASSDGGPKPQLRFSIEWLTAEEAARLTEHRASSVIDGRSLGFAEKEALDDENCLYISAGDSVVRFTRHSAAESARSVRVGNSREIE